MNPRILILHWGTRGGGPQMQLRIAQALAARADVSAFLSFDRRSEVALGLKNVRIPALVVGAVSKSRLLAVPLRIMGHLLDGPRLLRFCRRNRIEVIYEVMDHPFQVIPKMLARRRGIRVIGSVHDARRHAGEESALLDAIARLSARQMDGVMAYSATVGADLAAEAANWRVPIFQTVHGAFGAPGAILRPAPRRGQRIVVGFFGRIEKYKGLERLIECTQILQARGLDVHLIVCGRGALAADQVERLAALGSELDNRWIEEGQIQGIVAGFDVLALPYDEASQSGVIGYALNAGVPIVCTPVGGLAEQVQTSGGGVVAHGMRPSQFADAIERLASDPDLYGSSSASGLRAAQRDYSWDRVAGDVVAAAASVLATRSGTATGLPETERRG